ncbi:uncharacterized protein FIBRA_06502 [Fibroporia radiculosa]|uniref:BTB domain-containing protein n=1 Tax=Fibroporia radiculosa TaxID=599839 RepID=J4IBA7_9APHY|nr:uncharacterized protein FIBRA_06502 [Fibroporia radiculosa]CCM04331.1 predicted protein [Fibroporia radiculosa]
MSQVLDPTFASLSSDSHDEPPEQRVIAEGPKLHAQNDMGPQSAHPDTLEPATVRSDRFYFEHESIYLCVTNEDKHQSVLYRIHRYFLERDSEVFRDMFLCAPGEKKREGLTEETAIFLPGVTTHEIESLLSFLYHGMYKMEVSLDNWVALLSISSRYLFKEIRPLAIQAIAAHNPPLDPVERIVLAVKHDIPSWLQPAYIALGLRGDPLSDAEGEKLGLRATLLIARARETMLRRQVPAPESVNAIFRFGSPCTDWRSPEGDPIIEQASRSPPDHSPREIKIHSTSFYIEDDLIFLSENTHSGPRARHAVQSPSILSQARLGVFPQYVDVPTGRREERGDHRGDSNPSTGRHDARDRMLAVFSIPRVRPPPYAYRGAPTPAMYERKFGRHDWIALLSISSRYLFDKIRQRAIEALTSQDPPLDPVERIILAIKHNVMQMLMPSYIELCVRETPLSDHEGERLGLFVAIRIARAREEVFRKCIGGAKPKAKNTRLSLNGSSGEPWGAEMQEVADIVQNIMFAPR